MATLSEQLTASIEGRRLYNQERTILDLTELICQVLEETGVTRAQLAERLGKSKAHITQLLDGRANMTVRTIADIFTALGCEVQFVAREQYASLPSKSDISLETPATSTPRWGENWNAIWVGYENSQGDGIEESLFCLAD